MSASSALMRAMSSSALSLLYFSMRCILISSSRRMSSRVISRWNVYSTISCSTTPSAEFLAEGTRNIWFLNGSSFESMKLTTSSCDFDCSNFFSLYIRSSMKMRSNDEKNSCSSSSALRMRSSLRSSPIVVSVLWRSTSLTVRKHGLLSSITQQLGDMFISQSENAYNASMVLSLETPGAR